MIFSQELRLEVIRNFLTVKILSMAANKSFFVYVSHLLEMNTIYKKQNSLMIFKNIVLCQNLGVKSCLCQLLVVKLLTLYNPHETQFSIWTPCSPQSFSVHRILQARILERVAFPFSSESSQPRVWTWISCIADRFLTIMII